MIEQTQNIEDEILGYLDGATGYDEEVHRNPVDPVRIDNEGAYLFAYFTGETAQSHDQYGSMYDLEATVVFECLYASKDETTLFNTARDFAGKVQDVLKAHENEKTYSELHYKNAAIIREDSASVPCVGWKLTYTLRYDAS